MFYNWLRLVILVISKGFVDFNNGVLPRGWCGRQSWVEQTIVGFAS